jgi:hypothetical protein
VTRTRAEWWRTVAQEKDYLFLSFMHSEAPFEVVASALQDFERRYCREARTPAERVHLRQLAAIEILTEAFSMGRSWEDFAPHLKRLTRLGYPNLWKRVHVACIYVQALPYFPERARDAFALLADAERRVLRLRRRPAKTQLLNSIAHARQEAARYGVLSPGSSEAEPST